MILHPSRSGAVARLLLGLSAGGLSSLASALPAQAQTAATAPPNRIFVRGTINLNLAINPRFCLVSAGSEELAMEVWSSARPTSPKAPQTLWQMYVTEPGPGYQASLPVEATFRYKSLNFYFLADATKVPAVSIEAARNFTSGSINLLLHRSGRLPGVIRLRASWRCA